jgi:hypothetical protein
MPDAAFYVSICTFLLVKQVKQRLWRRYLYFCTSKASKLSILFEGFDENAFYVSMCTFVLVKQVNLYPLRRIR